MRSSELCPFVVLVDSAEQQPWTFQGFRCDSRRQYRPLDVNWQYACLGRYPQSRGDYSIQGCEGRIGIERKSVDDCRSTLLGWDSRRDRFSNELSNLAELESSCVIVEGTLEEVVTQVDDYGKKSRAHTAKSIYRSIIAFQQDYPVPWIFCNGRRWAETTAFRWMERFWRKHK